MIYKFKNPEWFDGVERPDFAGHNGNLIIYGAGFWGALTVHLLEKMNIKVLCFLDKDEKKQAGTYQGYPVLNPKEGKERYPGAAVIVTPNVHNPAFSYVKDELCFDTIFTPFSLFLEFDYAGFNDRGQLPGWYLTELTGGGQTMGYHMNVYLIRLANFYSLVRNKSDFKFRFEFTITEKCNLRCKECFSLMPYIENPKHFDIERIKRSFDILFAGRCIEEVNIEGGETFLYPHLSEVISYILGFSEVNKIVLFSNGTIIPSEKILKSLADPRILIRFSNYGKHSKNLERFAMECKKRGINYVIYNQEWYKFQRIPKQRNSEEDTMKVVENCCKMVYFSSCFVKDGKLYRCPFAAHGDSVQLFPKSNDYIDLLSEDENIQDKINDYFINPKPAIACYYCNGRGYTSESVPAAEQWEPGDTPKIERI